MTNLSTFLNSLKIDSRSSLLLNNVLAPAFIKIRSTIESSKGGFSDTQNSSGEKQLKLDVATNNVLVDFLEKSQLVHSLASEELDEVLKCNERGDFAVAFDPLDGSSLVDANMAVGTIFGVYSTGNNPENFTFIGQKGRNQVLSGIVVYGPKTTMLLAFPGHGVHLFELVLNNSSAEFVHVNGPISIAQDAKYFAPGNARACADRPEYLEVINDWINRGLTLRYSGGMVPDIAHIFVKGSGVLTYPSYSAAPNGKLRLLFECNPISLLIEEAGGVSADGNIAVLDLKINEIHQRTPIFCGSKNAVNEVCNKLRR